MKVHIKPPMLKESDKSFLQRHTPMVAVILVLAFVVAAIVGTVMVLRRDATTLAMQPAGPVAIADLPGPKGQLSERSRQQLETISKENIHVVGTLVIRYKYAKNESPIIYAQAYNAKVKTVIDTIVKTIDERQASDKAMSSEESQRLALQDPARAARALRNSEEARMGLIKCVPIEEVALQFPTLKNVATGVCYATIPPFEAKSSMAIIMLTDSQLTSFSEIAEMRRILLTLQIDIYNRDFQGRETWAHP